MDLLAGDTRTPTFLARNPWGQVPAVELDDGRVLTQSNALLLHFGEGSSFIPTDPVDRAAMLAWMFWEQNSHEPFIAVRRFHVVYHGRDPADLDPALLTRGEAAFDRMNTALTDHDFLVGDDPTLADLALVAYTRLADQGGFDIERFPALPQWVADTEAAFGIAARRRPVV